MVCACRGVQKLARTRPRAFAAVKITNSKTRPHCQNFLSFPLSLNYNQNLFEDRFDTNLTKSPSRW